MKYLPALSVFTVLALVGCESMNAPLTSSGSFDPLAPAGGVTKSSTSSSGVTFKPGSFVHASIDNTAFFAKRPKGDADADKLLVRDTRMKVISSDSSYVKVELDSGEVGFVPSVMVQDSSASSISVIDTSNMVVYPPLPPSGPVEPLPNLTPSNAPPDGIPPVITVDPSSTVPPSPTGAGDPSTTTPAASPSATPAATPSSTTTPPPLPPGGEDVVPGKEAQ